MRTIEYKQFSQVRPGELVPVLNDPTLRRHLVEHSLFDPNNIREWIDHKSRTDATPGCRVRVVYIGAEVAGWCGIQPDESGFEIAIVISKKFWGFGIAIFKELMGWAQELGHKELVFHLLETRAEYRLLKRKATKIKQTELLGRRFTTFFISVEKWHRG